MTVASSTSTVRSEPTSLAETTGMQRFGTSTVPTHVTGLLLLQQKWGAAVDSILSLREGEHPDCTRARLAWLEDQDFAKALEIMPRRSVAERAIWEHWNKGNRLEDKLGAITGVSPPSNEMLTLRSLAICAACMCMLIKATFGTSLCRHASSCRTLPHSLATLSTRTALLAMVRIFAVG